MVYIERPLITQIDTKDPAVLYSTDMKSTLKTILTQMYVGKCFKRCHVTEIIDIEDNSPPVMEAMRNGGSARISIRARVRGIVYDMFEVIPDAKIVEIIEDGKMLLRSRHAAIMIAADPRLQHFKVGMTVPIRAMESRYIPYRDTISVTGIPFVPIFNPPTDPFDVNFTTDDQDACEPLLTRLKELQKRFESVPHAKDWQNFLDGKIEPIAGFKAVDFTRVKGRGRITRQDWTPLMDTSVAWQDVKDEKTIKNSATVLKGYIAAAIKQLELACVMAEQYDWAIEKTAPWVALYRGEK
jgi:hypothetical protein